ncbi:MAG TPA: thermonuclease family protein, partial [Motiliproteus sp.]
MNGFLKALLASAFFVSAASALGASSDCSPPGPLQTASLRQVIDGDTLELSDGRRVRLIGINTPELAHDTRPAQPLADSARRAADAFLRRDPSATLQLAIGTDSHDRYGRLLAHVFDRDGNSLEAQLLEQGLGFPLSIPPNLALRDCLQQRAHHARTQGLGVWSHPAFAPRQVSTLTPADGGYGRYRGRVSRVDRNRSGWY